MQKIRTRKQHITNYQSLSATDHLYELKIRYTPTPQEIYHFFSLQKSPQENTVTKSNMLTCTFILTEAYVMKNGNGITTILKSTQTQWKLSNKCSIYTQGALT